MALQGPGETADRTDEPPEDSQLRVDIPSASLQLGPGDGEPILPWDRLSCWLHCICVVGFDLELGQAVEVIYPHHSKLTDKEKTSICYLSFPDSNSARADQPSPVSAAGSFTETARADQPSPVRAAAGSFTETAEQINPVLLEQQALSLRQPEQINPVLLEQQALSLRQPEQINPLLLEQLALSLRQPEQINPVLLEQQALSLRQPEQINPVLLEKQALSLRQPEQINPVLLESSRLFH
ncbi:UNVERIFIED_CONTAM: hypothetical protein FKN15_002790 [Acipenser sinensis]